MRGGAPPTNAVAGLRPPVMGSIPYTAHHPHFRRLPITSNAVSCDAWSDGRAKSRSLPNHIGDSPFSSHFVRGTFRRSDFDLIHVGEHFGRLRIQLSSYLNQETIMNVKTNVKAGWDKKPGSPH